MTALLSLVPAKKILLRDMPSRLAKLLQNLLVSQFVSVIRATVNLPRESKLIDVDISSTLKSETRAFRTPPIPVVSVAYPSSPGSSHRIRTCHFYRLQRLISENSFERDPTKSFKTLSADFLPDVLM